MNESEERKAFEAWWEADIDEVSAAAWRTMVNEDASEAKTNGWLSWLARASIAAKQSAEPVAWLHIQGRYTETSDRQLDADEVARGWTQQPLYATPPSPTAVEAPSLANLLVEIMEHPGGQYSEDRSWSYDKWAARVIAALASPTAGEARDAPDRTLWLVVRETAMEVGDGGRPVLAYQWPAEFPPFGTEAEAMAFLHADGGMALGWVVKSVAIASKP